MNVEIISPPRTIMEVFKMLPEGTLAELINGQLYMSPTPTNLHQRVSRKLLIKLSDFVEKNDLGEVFYAPLDIYFDKTSNAVQPDIIFISRNNESQPQDKIPYEGVPDLLIEILSPSNNKHDLVTKKDLYEKFGVKEYWIIDPTSKESIVYQLIGKEYKLLAKNTATLFSPLLNQSFTY
jgi:Uma2 family endonuclease